MKKRGFTLIELMVIVLIIGIFTSTVLSFIKKHSKDPKNKYASTSSSRTYDDTRAAPLVQKEEPKKLGTYILESGKELHCEGAVYGDGGVRLQYCDDGFSYYALTNVRVPNAQEREERE